MIVFGSLSQSSQKVVKIDLKYDKVTNNIHHHQRFFFPAFFLVNKRSSMVKNLQKSTSLSLFLSPSLSLFLSQDWKKNSFFPAAARRLSLETAEIQCQQKQKQKQKQLYYFCFFHSYHYRWYCYDCLASGWCYYSLLYQRQKQGQVQRQSCCLKTQSPCSSRKKTIFLQILRKKK